MREGVYACRGYLEGWEGREAMLGGECRERS